MSTTSNYHFFPSGTAIAHESETASDRSVGGQARRRRWWSWPRSSRRAAADGLSADQAFLSRALTELLQIEMPGSTARLFPGPLARLHIALLSTKHNSRLGHRILWAVAAVLGVTILACALSPASFYVDTTFVVGP